MIKNRKLSSFECTNMNRQLQGYSGPTKSTGEQHVKKDMKPFMKWLEDNQFPGINDFEIGFDPVHGLFSFISFS